MKRFAVFLFVLLFISKAFSQTNELTDAQIKDALVTQNAFGDYLKCKADNTFVSNFRTKGGDGYHFEGQYSINKGIISFSNVKGTEWADNIISTDNNGNLNFNSKYLYLPDTNNGTFIGSLYNLEDKSYFWSVKAIPSNMIIEINGTKVYKVNNEIYITENLKMRDTNSLKGKVVEIKGCDFRCNGWVEQSRKVVFKGMVIDGYIAKTVEMETIDGITAPWYYIQQQDHDPMDRREGDIYYVWIFGGYVKEYPVNEKHENPEELKKSVESIGLKFYQYTNDEKK
ncbi:MAG: hypothetical protein II973_13945 [Spirochaetaceae bacterium]|nr:hypothetical protein [Spirochaetaceae bacterium]